MSFRLEKRATNRDNRVDDAKEQIRSPLGVGQRLHQGGMAVHGLEADAGPFGGFPKQRLLFVGRGPELHGVSERFTDVVHVDGQLRAWVIVVLLAQSVLEFFPGALQLS